MKHLTTEFRPEQERFVKTEEIQQPSDDLLSFLDITQPIVGEEYLPTDYRHYLGELNTIAALNAVENDRSHPLWWFLPPILYDLFDEKTKFNWLVQEDTSSLSLMVVPPPFIEVVDQLREETKAIEIHTELSTRSYSRPFVGLLYGGYPWFESYFRIADKKGFFGLECVVLRASSETCDVPNSLERFKKRRRNSLGQSLQMAFDDLPYPGVLRPFHAPARIETCRHLLAAETCK